MKRILSLFSAAALLLAALSACGSKEPQAQDKQVDLAGFAQSVQQKHEFSSLERLDPADSEMGELYQNALDNYYPGLSGMDLAQMEMYMSMISFSGGELALVQAKSDGDAAKVKDIFQARLDSKTTDGPNNYPEELEMWQKYGKVVENGSYVMLVNHPDSEAIVSEFQALFA